MPYCKCIFGSEVRSSPSEGEGLLGCSEQPVTEGEPLSSEIVRGAFCALNEAPPHILPEERRGQIFIGEAVRMIWLSEVAERLAADAEALIRMDNATVVWGLSKRTAPAGSTKAGPFLGACDGGATCRAEVCSTAKGDVGEDP